MAACRFPGSDSSDWNRRPIAIDRSRGRRDCRYQQVGFCYEHPKFASTYQPASPMAVPPVMECSLDSAVSRPPRLSVAGGTSSIWRQQREECTGVRAVAAAGGVHYRWQQIRFRHEWQRAGTPLDQGGRRFWLLDRRWAEGTFCNASQRSGAPLSAGRLSVAGDRFSEWA